jgi:hypothetical protein
LALRSIIWCLTGSSYYRDKKVVSVFLFTCVFHCLHPDSRNSEEMQVGGIPRWSQDESQDESADELYQKIRG